MLDLVLSGYVRFSFKWYSIGVKSRENWQEEVLKQISKNGIPDHIIDFKDKDEKLDFWLYLLM